MRFQPPNNIVSDNLLHAGAIIKLGNDVHKRSDNSIGYIDDCFGQYILKIILNFNSHYETKLIHPIPLL